MAQSESWSTPARIEAEVRRLQAEIRVAGQRAAVLAPGPDTGTGTGSAGVGEGEADDVGYRAAVGEGGGGGGDYRAALGKASGDSGHRPAVGESSGDYRAALGEASDGGHWAAVGEGRNGRGGHRAAVGEASGVGHRAAVGERGGADYRAAVGAVAAATRALVEYEAAIPGLQEGYRRHVNARITRWSGGLLALVGAVGGVAAGCGALAFWWLFPSIALAAAGLLNMAGTRRRAADPALRPRIGAACFAVAGIVAAICAGRLLPPAALLVAFVACWVGLYAFRLLGAAPAPEAVEAREAR